MLNKLNNVFQSKKRTTTTRALTLSNLSVLSDTPTTLLSSMSSMSTATFHNFMKTRYPLCPSDLITEFLYEKKLTRGTVTFAAVHDDIEQDERFQRYDQVKFENDLVNFFCSKRHKIDFFNESDRSKALDILDSPAFDKNNLQLYRKAIYCTVGIAYLFYRPTNLKYDTDLALYAMACGSSKICNEICNIDNFKNNLKINLMGALNIPEFACYSISDEMFQNHIFALWCLILQVSDDDAFMTYSSFFSGNVSGKIELAIQQMIVWNNPLNLCDLSQELKHDRDTIIYFLENNGICCFCEETNDIPQEYLMDINFLIYAVINFPIGSLIMNEELTGLRENLTSADCNIDLVTAVLLIDHNCYEIIHEDLKNDVSKVEYFQEIIFLSKTVTNGFDEVNNEANPFSLETFNKYKSRHAELIDEIKGKYAKIIQKNENNIYDVCFKLDNHGDPISYYQSLSEDLKNNAAIIFMLVKSSVITKYISLHINKEEIKSNNQSKKRKIQEHEKGAQEIERNQTTKNEEAGNEKTRKEEEEEHQEEEALNNLLSKYANLKVIDILDIIPSTFFGEYPEHYETIKMLFDVTSIHCKVSYNFKRHYLNCYRL